MRNVLILCALMFAALTGIAQLNCGQAIYSNHYRAQHPELAEQIKAQEEQLFQMGSATPSQRAETIIIPVVFTIIHDNGPENISDDQVLDAIRIMNEDFNAMNPELDDVVSSFAGVIGDAEIEFRLAAIDPQGEPTNGIQRIESLETYVGDNGSKLAGWPRSDYLNIWVTDAITVVGASAAAFALLPSDANGQPGVDGVISNHRYVGTIGTATSDGKTLTHEVGHYLGLRHTWGPTNFPGCDGTASNQNDPCFGINNCDGDDGVSDTPNCLGVDNFSCNTSQVSCGSLDNVQNHMDYATCESMFTVGQINLMRASLNSSIAERSSLWTTSNHAATGVTALTKADYRVGRATACRGESVQFFDASRYDPDAWEWEITGPATFTSDVQNPTFIFKDPGYYTVSLTVTQGTVTESITEEHAFYVSDVYGNATPLMEDFSDPLDGWVTVNRGIDNDKYEWDYNDEVGYDDNASYYVYNIGNNDNPNADELILSSVDFRPMQQINVDFKVAYARLNNDDADRLSLLVSNDCGESWITTWSGNASQLNGSKPLSSSIFEPESQSDWESFTVTNIPASWLGPDALLKFSFEPGGGNQLYLDNVNIDGEFSVIPYLVYPPDDALQMNNDVVLDWRGVVGASEYEYQVSKNDGFTSNVFTGSKDVIDDEDSGNEDTRFKTSGLENATEYFWRVRATVGSTTTAWSDIWSFIVADDGVGITKSENTTVSIYPNPATDRLQIIFPNEIGKARLKIYSMSGKLVQKVNVASAAPNRMTSIDVRNLTNGIYLLEVDAANKQWNQRFIINR